MSRIPDDVVLAAWAVFHDFPMDQDKALRAAGEVFVRWEREQCSSLCLKPIRRKAGYGGRWEGYGDFEDLMNGAECSRAIEARNKE